MEVDEGVTTRTLLDPKFKKVCRVLFQFMCYCQEPCEKLEVELISVA